MTKYYTIAYLKSSDGINLLVGLSPDGPDARSAVRAEAMTFIKDQRKDNFDEEPPFREDDITYEFGIELTNTEPEDEDRIACYGFEMGLCDENNVQFKYALRPPAPPERIW